MSLQSDRSLMSLRHFRVLCAGLGLLALTGCQTGSGNSGLTLGASAPSVPAKSLTPDEQAFEQARRAYGLGDYEKSYRISKALVASGFGPAYNLIYLHYAYGYGARIDRPRGLELLRKGVTAGDARAEASLGNLYRRGGEVEKDYGKALELLRRSSAKGNTFAKRLIASMYHRGQGVPKDGAEARQIELEAYREEQSRAETGDLQARHRLALHLISGRGVARDRAEGIEVMKRNAQAGYAASMQWLARQYFYGRLLPRDRKQEVFWHKKLAAMGQPSSQLNLAFRYQRGTGVEKNERRAVELMRAAAKKGLRAAADRLARQLLTSKVLKRDPSEAAFWAKQAAEDGYVPTMVLYGFLLERGVGVQRDFVAARGWYEKALEKGRRDVNDLLGRLYLYGNGIEQNPVKAVRYFEEALKHLRPGARKVRTTWLREIAVTRLTPEQLRDLQAEGLLADVSRDSVGKDNPNATAAVIQRLSTDSPEKVVSLLSDTLKHLAPGNKKAESQTYILRSVAHYRAGRFKEALTDVDAGIALGNPRAMDFAHRGSIHFRLENYADSRSDFTSALRLDPDNARYLIGRGFAQIRIGKRENLIAGFLDMRRAFDLEPDNPDFRALFERLGFFNTRI